MTLVRSFLILSLAMCSSLSIADDAAKTNLLKSTNDLESWRFEQHEGAAGKMEVKDDAIVFQDEKLTGTDWHLQAFQTDLDLKDGTEYELKFEVKSDRSRELIVIGMIDEEDWHEIGLRESIYLQKEYKAQKLTFRAEGVVAKKNRIGFVLGTDRGIVYVRNMTLTEVAKK